MEKRLSQKRINKIFIAFFLLLFVVMGFSLSYFYSNTDKKQSAHDCLFLESAIINLFKNQLNSELNFYLQTIESQKPYIIAHIKKELKNHLTKKINGINKNKSIKNQLISKLKKCSKHHNSYLFNKKGKLLFAKNKNKAQIKKLKKAVLSGTFSENTVVVSINNFYVIECFSLGFLNNKLKRKLVSIIQNSKNSNYLFAFAYHLENGKIVLDSLAAHPRKKNLRLNLSNSKSNDYKTFMDMQKNLAPLLDINGEIFFQYKYSINGANFSKLTYFKLLPKYNLVLAKGFLKKELLNILEQKKQNNKSMVYSTIKKVVSILAVFALIGLVLQSVFINQNSKVLSYYKAHMKKKDSSISRINQRLNKTIDMQKMFEIQKNEWQKKFEILSENSGQLYFEFNLKTKQTVWGKHFDDVLKIFKNSHSFSYLDVLERIHKEDKAATIKSFVLAQKNIGSFEKEFRFSNDVSGFSFLKIRGVFLTSNNKEAELLIGLIQDLSNERKSQLQLTKSENLYKSTINAFNYPIYVLNSNYKILIANRAFKKAIILLGYGEVNLQENIKDIFPFIPPTTFETFRTVFNEGTIKVYEETNDYADETWRYTENTVIPIYENKKAQKILVMMRNITAEKKAELEKKRLWTAIEQASDGIIIADINSKILYVNPAYLQTTGYALDELINKKTAIFQSGQTDEALYDRLWGTIQKGDVWQGEFKNIKKNGESFIEECIITPVKNEEGVIQNYVAIKRDVTEEKKHRMQMIQDDKMRAMGTLAGGIAHDFNNVLQNMYTHMFLLDLESGLSTEGKKALSVIKQSQAKASKLVSQILNFSRQEVIKSQSISPKKVIEDEIKMLYAILPSSVKIDAKLNECKNIYSSSVEIHQLITNLCTNAKDAMEGKGTITVSLQDYTDKNNKIWVLLSVCDTGVGIDEETKKSIFNPFYTTKKPGKGTGLGLATVHSIVKKTGGYINVKSKPFKGTCFEIFFPGDDVV